jgi:hypothetical protein
VEDEGRGNAFHPEGSFFYNLAWLASALKEWEPLEIVRAWVCFVNNPVRSFGSEHEFSRETLVCLALYLLTYNNKVAWVEDHGVALRLRNAADYRLPTFGPHGTKLGHY